MSNSVNGRLFLEPYVNSQKVNLKVKNGWGEVEAKTSLIGLKLLKDAQISVNLNLFTLPAGCVVFFREDLFITNESYKQVHTLGDYKEQFVIGNYNDAIYIALKD